MIKFIADRSSERNLVHSETPLIGDPHWPWPTFISSETPRFSLETPRAFIIQDPKLLRNTKLIIGDFRISLKNPIFFIWTHRFWLETPSCSSETPDFHWRAIEGITGGPVTPCTPMATSSLEMHPLGLTYYPKKIYEEEGYPQMMRLQRRPYRFILSVVFYLWFPATLNLLFSLSNY